MNGPPADSESPPLLYNVDRATGVARITLNRPQRRNALNGQMLRLLDETIGDCANDEAVKAIIIDGAGGAFCSGVDTEELAGGAGAGPHSPGPGGPEALRRGFELSHRVILGLFNIEKPVIASIEGPAVGAGLDIACACDIRIAARDARFSAAYIRVGLFPGYGGAWFYPRLFGLAKASEMILTGDFIGADDALSAGFLNRVVEEGQLERESGELAVRLASGPPIATRLAKSVMHSSLGMDLATSLRVAAAAESITLSSADHAEGMAAAREKRPPVYRGV